LSHPGYGTLISSGSDTVATDHKTAWKDHPPVLSGAPPIPPDDLHAPEDLDDLEDLEDLESLEDLSTKELTKETEKTSQSLLESDLPCRNKTNFYSVVVGKCCGIFMSWLVETLVH
jgi:hypothetical protein